MKKKIKILIILLILLVLYIYIANITLFPKSIILMQGEKINLAKLWGIELKENDNAEKSVGESVITKTMEASTNTADSVNRVGKVDLKLNLFQIPLSEVNVNVIPKSSVIPLGNSIGLKLYTEGVLVVGMTEIEGEKPYENTGIKQGDRIISIDDKQIENTEDLIETVNSSNGKNLTIKYISKTTEETTNIVPVKTKNNEYKLGLWVRDAAARSRNGHIL